MPTETETGCRAVLPRRMRHNKWLSEIHDDNSHDEECTLKETDPSDIPASRPMTEITVDPETGATPGDAEDKEGCR